MPYHGEIAKNNGAADISASDLCFVFTGMGRQVQIKKAAHPIKSRILTTKLPLNDPFCGCSVFAVLGIFLGKRHIDSH